ncbi:alpha/beta fold hydrolase [Streptomyces sp. AK02-04a]|uniref:alpha/beta fold hydrolase n=1 Tax=Streptomyces sp. AK02-04a TaxID=3028649 RepID=UPI0039F568B9
MEREFVMPYVMVGRENNGDIRIHYEDHGAGPPVVLVHGYLANGRSWEKQEAALLTAGYRVISYDRRGSGDSGRPAGGYDYDTPAADLNILLEVLDVLDAVLVGCCSGTGELTRYLGTYGQRRVRGAALLAPLPPFLPRSDANPEGIAPGDLDAFLGELSADRAPRSAAGGRPAHSATVSSGSPREVIWPGWPPSRRAPRPMRRWTSPCSITPSRRCRPRPTVRPG